MIAVCFLFSMDILWVFNKPMVGEKGVKMRIGILTLELGKNYGGILQAYALQEVLKRMGHEAFLIVKHIGIHERKMRRKHAIMVKCTLPFIAKHISPQIKVKSLYDLEISYFDVIIVGSDQVWRGEYANITHMFLDFIHKGSGCKKVAYAASFGVSDWKFSPEVTTKIAILAKQFDAISVREDSGVTLCHDHLGVNALHVLDPTMLLTMQDYIQNFHIADIPSSKGQLVVCLLDFTTDKKAVVDNVASTRNYTVFFLNAQNNRRNMRLGNRISICLEQWLRGFSDASFIVTDSFHGCVFSILFNKPFIAYGNKLRGIARFTSLLKMLGLENHLIFSSRELTKERLEDTAIVWEKVNEKLKKIRTQSEAFLIGVLVPKDVLTVKSTWKLFPSQKEHFSSRRRHRKKERR